jgi:methylmalonyl-CoA/ethylmalonyl-CoA epimerase
MKAVPKPDCPLDICVHDHVAMAHVGNVDRSIEFYTLLGFACASRFTDNEDAAYYAAMISGKAEIMFARASGPIVASQQAVLFYMYASDVKALRSHLLARGLVDAGQVPGERKQEDIIRSIPEGACLFEINYPPYMHEGELRVHDPDGYVILIGQTERRIAGSTVPGQIGQIAITVSDVPTAANFYRNVIGLRPLMDAGPNLAFLTDGSLRVMLTTPQGAGKVGSNSTLYFHVRNIEQSFQSMLDKGTTCERLPQLAATLPDHELWIGILRDPDGNLVAIMEEKRK